MPMELILNKINGTCLPPVSSIFKKISPKILDRTVYIHSAILLTGKGARTARIGK